VLDHGKELAVAHVLYALALERGERLLNRHHDGQRDYYIQDHRLTPFFVIHLHTVRLLEEVSS
jgi:hypothetical protein